MRIRPITLLSLLFFTLAAQAAEENARFHKTVHKIRILGEGAGYTKTVTCNGSFLTADRQIVFAGSELEHFSDFRSIQDKNAGTNKDFELTEQSVTGRNFYDGLKVYQLQWLDTTRDFTLSYQVSCDQLLMLSSLPLATYPNTDTLVYEITCPGNYQISFNEEDKPEGLKIDTIQSKNSCLYRIVLYPPKMTLRRARYSQFEFSKQVRPSLRLIVTKTNDQDGWRYFNDWYYELVQPHSSLKRKTLKIFDSLISTHKSEDEIVRDAFNFVKTHIRYLAIENGLEAFRPRDVNDVIHNRYGDCKDMANVLTQILTHYGVKANIAIIASQGHDNKMDFPSLASADHAICVATTSDGKKYFLDATDKYGIHSLPSAFTQGRDYFAVDKTGGLNGKVPVITAGRNFSKSTMQLSASGSSLQGTSTLTCSNYDAFRLKAIAGGSDRQAYKRRLMKYTTDSRASTSFDDIKTVEADTTFMITSNFSINNSLLRIEDKNYLILNFLTFPHQFPKNIKEKCRFVPRQTFTHQFNYDIVFESDVKIFPEQTNFSESTESCAFDFTLEKKSDRSVRIQYVYTIKKTELNEEEIIQYERLNDNIMKLFSASVQYEVAR